MGSYLFTNVRILDGSGENNPYSGSVLVQGNRIRQVGRSTAVFVEGMGGGEGPLQTFTPEERAFMLLARRFEYR